MVGAIVTARPPYGQRKRDQHEDRQQMDRAPGTDQPDLVDPERGDRHRRHQGYPDPPQGAMGQRALGRGELDNAQHEGGHRREGMNGIWGTALSNGARLTANSLMSI